MVLCQTKVPITQHTVHSTLAQGICKSIFIHWMYCTFCHLLQEPGLSTRDVVWLPHIATLFLMSYTKILLTVTNALSMSRLPCNDSILTVWIVDGNIEYACVHVQTMKSDEHILVWDMRNSVAICGNQTTSLVESPALVIGDKMCSTFNEWIYSCRCPEQECYVLCVEL